MRGPSSTLCSSSLDVSIALTQFNVQFSSTRNLLAQPSECWKSDLLTLVALFSAVQTRRSQNYQSHSQAMPSSSRIKRLALQHWYGLASWSARLVDNGYKRYYRTTAFAPTQTLPPPLFQFCSLLHCFNLFLLLQGLK